MIEAQDNERMMKQELLEANKALKKAVETNADTIQKYTSSKKIISELKRALKLSKEESRLLENERKRLTVENTELNKAIEKMDRVVYGNSGGTFHVVDPSEQVTNENLSSADEEKDGGALDDISSADALKLVQSMTNVVDDTLNSKYAKKYNKRLSMYKSRLCVSKKSNRSTGRSFSKSFRATKGSRSIDKSKQNVRKLR